jgi:CheY-like chemotaxis protein
MSLILVADDDRDIRELFELLLSRAGHDVETAADGLEAVEMYRAHRPDLVVLDFNMPGLTGIEVTRELRSCEGSNVPILLVTASATSGDLAEAAEAGISDHMIKPPAPTSLCERVAHLLSAQTCAGRQPGA